MTTNPNTFTSNAMKTTSACNPNLADGNLEYLKWAHDNKIGKEYGLTLTNGADTEHDIVIAAGQRWSSDYANLIIYAGGTIALDASGAGGLDTGSPANATQYYIWLCKGASGVSAVFSAHATAPTLPSGYDVDKVCIGRVITDGSANIDNTQLWTKHPDGTETYIYTQASGNFPGAETTITHNLGTKNVHVIPLAVKDADGDEYILHTGNYPEGHSPVHVDTTNVVKIQFATDFSADNTNIESSADYSLKVVIKTRLS
jgi:hypothetical protein